MFNLKHTLLIVICAALLLAACSGAPAGTPATAPTAEPTTAPAATNTPAPTATSEATATLEPTVAAPPLAGGDCLVGNWNFADMSDYFASVMSQAGGVAEYIGEEGSVNYTFGADGKAQVEADNFTIKLRATTQGLALDINVKINGTATADYTTHEPNEITFANAQTSGFTFSATLNEQELFSGTPDEMMALFGVSPDPQYNTFTYECSATTLKYTPPVPNARPVVLERIP